MKRKVYSMKELAELIPELENKRREEISVNTMTYVLALMDVWAEDNGLILFQILNTSDSGSYFIFDDRGTFGGWAA